MRFLPPLALIPGPTLSRPNQSPFRHRRELGGPGTRYTAIAAGAGHTVALKTNGSVVSWGALAQTTVPIDLPPAFAIAAGQAYTMALVRDPPPSLTLLRNVDQTVSLSWRDAGALERTASLTAPNWQPAPNQANPQTLSTTGSTKFYRVKAD